MTFKEVERSAQESGPRPVEFDAVFFDLFGTLLGFDYKRLPEVEFEGRKMRTTTLKVYEEVCRRFALRIDYSDFLSEFLEASRELEEIKSDGREYPSARRFEMLRRRLGIRDQEAVETMVRSHMQQMFEMMVLPRETQRVLGRLSAIPKFLASNFDHAATVRRALESFGLSVHFQDVYVSEEVGWRKPASQFFENISQASGQVPERCLFVGDDPRADCEGAGRAGFRVAWLARNSDADRSCPHANWKLSSLAELPPLIKTVT